MQTWLIVNLRIPGFHRWSDAPDEYSYLRNWHRHEFHIKAEIKVPDNRTYEFIKIKDYIYNFLLDRLGAYNDEERTSDLTYASWLYHCIVLNENKIEKSSVEGLALFIAKELDQKYKNEGIKVTVMEDSENGARIEL